MPGGYRVGWGAGGLGGMEGPLVILFSVHHLLFRRHSFSVGRPTIFKNVTHSFPLRNTESTLLINVILTE